MSDTVGQPRLVLASGSRFRRQMLTAAGVAHVSVLPPVDEDVERARILSETPSMAPDSLALALAKVKALSVSAGRPEDWVIGADQVMALDGAMYSKPRDLAEARSHLMALSGQTHTLYSAVALAKRGKIEWELISPARMTMRALSGDEIDRYLARAGDQVCHTVGAYALEGLGAQLFERIEGDYFAIIGLPLLPVLVALRHHGHDCL